jgi:hypothetical protein
MQNIFLTTHVCKIGLIRVEIFFFCKNAENEHIVGELYLHNQVTTFSLREIRQLPLRDKSCSTAVCVHLPVVQLPAVQPLAVQPPAVQPP